jgi:hypothetical protein
MMKTLRRSRKLCLAQFEDEEATSESEYEGEDTVVGWLQADPFQPEAMRRLSVGTTRMGKTVGAQAAASRVLGAYPNARVVIFTPIPESYDRVDDLLDANAGSKDDSPRVERIQPTDFSVNSESLGELPAVSIVTPRETGDCTHLARGFNRFADHLRGDETDESDPPVYLIVDDADQLLSPSENTDFRNLMRATRGDSIAIHVLAQRTDVEQVRPIPDRYTVIDQYQMGEAETRGWQRRCAVSDDEAAFLRHEANGPQRLSAGDESGRPESAWTLARRAAPTGLCYTQEKGWNRVRYTLFNAELEALLASTSSSASESRSVEEDKEA